MKIHSTDFNLDSQKSFLLLVIVGIIFFSFGILIKVYLPYSSYALSKVHISGIVLSVFVYDGWENILAFFLIIFFFVITSLNRSPVQRLHLVTFSIIVMFVGGFVANAVWYLFVAQYQQSTYGQSGIVLAFVGVVFGTAVLRLWNNQYILHKPKNNEDKKEFYRESIIAWSSLLFMLIVPFLLHSGPSNTNFSVHGTAFLVGFVLTYFYIRHERRSKTL